MPTLLVCGERDLVGGAEAAQATGELDPDARLVCAGRLGHPDRTAELVTSFVR